MERSVAENRVEFCLGEATLLQKGLRLLEVLIVLYLSKGSGVEETEPSACRLSRLLHLQKLWLRMHQAAQVEG